MTPCVFAFNAFVKKFACALLLFTILEVEAIASPSEPTVISGEASFVSTPQKLEVTAHDKTIISWKDFSIAPNETTRFNLPDVRSVILNRVDSASLSKIEGLLSSNGIVYLINPSGIVITPSGKIDTAGFLASTLNVTDQDFLNGGDLLFTGSGSLVNLGAIQCSNGDVILMAAQLKNAGTIEAPKGKIALAAAHEVLMTVQGEEKLRVRLAAPSVPKEEIGLHQTGTLQALQAELKADGNLYAYAIKNEGRINATATATRGGRIYLVADQGHVTSSGTLSAPGGEVRILGQIADLADQAQIDVSHERGGGTVLIGGDYQGKNPEILNAQRTFVGPEVALSAAALENGQGGKVIAWADGETFFYGKIDAQGGPLGGDGGFAEVSGKDTLDFRGNVNLMAPQGKTGTLLLDPSNLTLSTAGDSNVTFTACPTGTYATTASPANILISEILTNLNSCSISITSSGGSGGTGTITVLNPINWTGTNTNTLTVTSSDVLTFNAAVTNATTAGTMAWTSDTTTVINAPITASGALSPVISISSVGAVTQNPGGTLTNSSSAGTLSLSTTTAVGISLGDAVTISSGSTGSVTILSGQDITVLPNGANSFVNTSSTGSLSVTADRNMTFISGVAIQSSATGASTTLFRSGATTAGEMSIGAGCSIATSGAGLLTLEAFNSVSTTALDFAGTINHTSSGLFLIETATSSGGNIVTEATSAITMTGPLTISALLGGFGTITIGGPITSAATLNITANTGLALNSTITNTGSGSTTLSTTTGGITTAFTNTGMTFNAGSGAVSITAGAGAIAFNEETTLQLNPNAGSLSMSAPSSNITLGLNTILNSGTGQSASIIAGGNVTLSNFTYNQSGTCTLTAGPSSSFTFAGNGNTFQAGNLSTSGPINITAASTINFGSGNAFNIGSAAMVQGVTFLAGTGISANNPSTIDFFSNATTLSMTSTTGGILLSNLTYGASGAGAVTAPAGALTLNGTLTTSGANNPLTLTGEAASGSTAISLNGPINHGSTAALLFTTPTSGTQTGNIVTTGACAITVTGDTLTIDTTANNSGSSHGGTINIGGPITFMPGSTGTLNITAQNFGAVATGLSLNGNITYSGTGNVNLTTASGALTTSASSTALTFSNGLLATISALGAVTLNAATTLQVNAGGPSLSMSAGTNLVLGSIVSLNGGGLQTASLSGSTVTLSNFTYNQGGACTISAGAGSTVQVTSAGGIFQAGTQGPCGTIGITAGTAMSFGADSIFSIGSTSAVGAVTLSAGTSITAGAGSLLEFFSNATALSMSAGTTLTLVNLNYGPSSLTTGTVTATAGALTLSGTLATSSTAPLTLKGEAAAGATAINLSGALIDHGSSGLLTFNTPSTGNILTTAATAITQTNGPITFSTTTNGSITLAGPILNTSGGPFTASASGTSTVTLNGPYASFNPGAAVSITAGTGGVVLSVPSMEFGPTSGSLAVNSTGTILINSALSYSSPGTCTFTGTTAAGNITSTTTGIMTFNSGSGDVTFESVASSITISSAPITFNPGAGNVTVKTDATGTQVSLGIFDFESGSGKTATITSNTALTFAGDFTAGIGSGSSTISSTAANIQAGGHTLTFNGASLSMTAATNIALSNLTYGTTGASTVTATLGELTISGTLTTSGAANPLTLTGEAATGSTAISLTGPINHGSSAALVFTTPTTGANQTGNIVASAANVINVTGGTLTLDTSASSSGGIIGIAGPITFASGSTGNLNITAHNVSGGTGVQLTNDITYSGTGTVNITTALGTIATSASTQALTINSGGLVTISAGTNIDLGVGFFTLQFNPGAGSLNMTAGGSITIDDIVNLNSGGSNTANIVAANNIIFNNFAYNQGGACTITAAAGSVTLTGGGGFSGGGFQAGNLSSCGAIDITAGTTIAISPTSFFNIGAAFSVGAVTLQAAGAITANVPSTIDFFSNATTLSMTSTGGAITLDTFTYGAGGSGAIDAEGGELTISDTLTTSGAGALTLEGFAAPSMPAFSLAGPINHNSSGTLTFLAPSTGDITTTAANVITATSGSLVFATTTGGALTIGGPITFTTTATGTLNATSQGALTIGAAAPITNNSAVSTMTWTSNSTTAIDAPILSGPGGAPGITFSSAGSITQAAGATLTNSSATGSLSLTTTSAADITLGAAIANSSTSGSVTIDSGRDILPGAAASFSHSSATGTLSLIAARNLTMTSGATVSITSPGASSTSFIAGNTTPGTLTFTAGNPITASGKGSLTLQGSNLTGVTALDLLGAINYNSSGPFTMTAPTTGNLIFTPPSGDFQLGGNGATGTSQISTGAGDITLTLPGKMTLIGSSNPALIASGGALALTSTGSLTLSAGSGAARIASSGSAAISASSISLGGVIGASAATIQTTSGDLTLTSQTGPLTLMDNASIGLSGSGTLTVTASASDLVVQNAASISNTGSGSTGITVHGMATLLGGLANASLVGGAGLTTLTVTGNLNLASNAGGSALINASGPLTITAENITLSGHGTNQQSVISTTAGAMLLTAQNTLNAADNSLIANSGPGSLTLVVDNNAGCAVGTGRFALAPNASLMSTGLLSIYTAQPNGILAGNLAFGTVNGVSIVAGLACAFDAPPPSANAVYMTCYPAGVASAPYTIFFKSVGVFAETPAEGF